MSLAWESSKDLGRELGRNLGRAYPMTLATEYVGTADVVGLEPEVVWLFDFKTGYHALPPPVDNWQLKLLALAATRAYRRKRAKVGLIWLRTDGEARFQIGELDELALAMAASELRAKRWEPGGTPVQGEHCTYCNAFDHCPAKLAIFRQAIEIPEITDDNAAAVYLRAEAVAQVLGRVRAALAMRAKDHPITLPNGMIYGPVQTSRESVDPIVVQSVLTQLHGPEVARKALDIESSKAAIGRAIETVAARGQKAKLVRAALKQIASEGGIKTKVTESVMEHKPRDNYGRGSLEDQAAAGRGVLLEDVGTEETP